MGTLSRREFARLLALSGSATLLPSRAFADDRSLFDEFGVTRAPLRPTPRDPDESFWRDVRAKFLIPRDVAFLNSANLCPMSLPVVEAIERNTRLYEAGPTPKVRDGLMKGREEARVLLAAALRVTPEELVLTRNTTEGNNFVSSGLKLGAGDEVVVSSDNHPSNLNAWRQKATRFGFTVVTVAPPAAHPGADAYVESFTKAFTPRTKVVAVTHVSSNSGDLLPVNELCRVARERGVLSLVDGAQSFGVLDVNLGEMKPDFYTGSFHKWPCGPKEKGIFFVNSAVQDRITPSVYGVYGGAVGISQRFEAEGQRDDAAIAAVVEAIKLQGSIGRDVIEKRSRGLAQHLMSEVRKLDGAQLWTDPTPDRCAAIVVFKPGSLDPARLNAALSEKDRIVCTVHAARPTETRPGLRVATHFYNTLEDVDRLVSTIKRYIKRGV
jgi:selenocysteine lyase/cysteine desulfurase